MPILGIVTAVECYPLTGKPLMVEVVAWQNDLSIEKTKTVFLTLRDKAC